MIDRFPHLALLSLEWQACPLEDETPLPLDLEDAEGLYVYGLGKGEIYEQILPWLRSDERRRAIFLEDDTSRFAAFLNTSPELLSDPQVHLSLLAKGETSLLAEKFPLRKLKFAALPSYRGRKFRRLQTELLRKTALSFAFRLDRLHGDILFQNFIHNVRLLPKSFYANGLKDAFKNTPAIVCGAGPSLSINALRPCQEKALLIAGGSSLAALVSQGIFPHFGMAVDPNPEELERLQNSLTPHTPLLYSTRVFHKIFETCKSPLGYMSAQMGGVPEGWIEEALQLKGPAFEAFVSIEATSVTAICIAWAYFLGCNPILLNGIDLAYTNGERYAKGVVAKTPHKEETILRKGRKGKRVKTAIRWVMESAAISRFAKEHPETRLIDTTEEGLGFKGIETLCLQEVALPAVSNLRERIQRAILASPMPQNSAQIISEKLQEMEESLERVIGYLKILTGEQKGSKPLAEMEMKEEMAYEQLLYGAEALFSGDWKEVLSLARKY